MAQDSFETSIERPGPTQRPDYIPGLDIILGSLNITPEGKAAADAAAKYKYLVDKGYIDADGNGVFSNQEYAAGIGNTYKAATPAEAKYKYLLDKGYIDADGNGVFSNEEYAAGIGNTYQEPIDDLTKIDPDLTGDDADLSGNQAADDLQVQNIINQAQGITAGSFDAVWKDLPEDLEELEKELTEQLQNSLLKGGGVGWEFNPEEGDSIFFKLPIVIPGLSGIMKIKIRNPDGSFKKPGEIAAAVGTQVKSTVNEVIALPGKLLEQAGTILGQSGELAGILAGTSTKTLEEHIGDIFGGIFGIGDKRRTGDVWEILIAQLTEETIKNETKEGGVLWSDAAAEDVEATTETPVVTEELPITVEDPPVVTEDPPVVTEDPPVVTEDPPVVTEDPPVVTEDPPVVTEDTPVVTEDTPVVTEDPPVVTEELPITIEDTPVVTEDPVFVTEELPVVTEDLPIITEELPFVLEELPITTEDPPVVTEDPPVVTEDPPVVTEDPPVVTEDPPVVTEDTPVVTEDTPVVTEDPPVVTGVSSSGGGGGGGGGYAAFGMMSGQAPRLQLPDFRAVLPQQKDYTVALNKIIQESLFEGMI
jgi:hypothetical protein